MYNRGVISEAKPRVEKRRVEEVGRGGGAATIGELIDRGADQGWWKAMVDRDRVVLCRPDGYKKDEKVYEQRGIAKRIDDRGERGTAMLSSCVRSDGRVGLIRDGLVMVRPARLTEPC